MVTRTTSVRFDRADKEAIRVIRERWGAPSLNAAVSYALRVVARVGEATVSFDHLVGEKRVTVVRLDEVDDEAIRLIRECWSLSSDTDAIRFALRVLASAERLEIVLARPKPE